MNELPCTVHVNVHTGSVQNIIFSELLALVLSHHFFIVKHTCTCIHLVSKHAHACTHTCTCMYYAHQVHVHSSPPMLAFMYIHVHVVIHEQMCAGYVYTKYIHVCTCIYMYIPNSMKNTFMNLMKPQKYYLANLSRVCAKLDKLLLCNSRVF